MPLGLITGVVLAVGAEVVLGLVFDVLGFAFVVLGVAFGVLAFAWAVLVVADVVLLRFAGCFPFTFCRTLLPPDVKEISSSSVELGSLVCKTYV